MHLVYCTVHPCFSVNYGFHHSPQINLPSHGYSNCHKFSSLARINQIISPGESQSWKKKNLFLVDKLTQDHENCAESFDLVPLVPGSLFPKTILILIVTYKYPFNKYLLVKLI